MRPHRREAQTRVEERSCGRKARFRSRQAALFRARQIQEESDGLTLMEPYHCRFCNSHHLHTVRRTPRRRDR
jgi:hypothetical protein